MPGRIPFSIEKNRIPGQVEWSGEKRRDFLELEDEDGMVPGLGPSLVEPEGHEACIGRHNRVALPAMLFFIFSLSIQHFNP
jgi:hypothetical protein